MLNTSYHEEYTTSQGLSYFKQGRFDKAIPHLEHQAIHSKDPVALSYYGLCTAIVENKAEQGVSLCVMALKYDPKNPDFYYNLGRALILSGQKSMAWRVLNKGLKYEPNHISILNELGKLGRRRSPVIPFLSRSNPLNRYLGRLTYYILLRFTLSQIK